jgi:plasmid stabilization system protein ParE
MIIFSPDALEDVARLRSFLNEANQGAAQRAMTLILAAIERLQELPDRGRRTDDADQTRVFPSCIPPHAEGRTRRHDTLSCGLRWTRKRRKTSASCRGRRSRVVLAPQGWR